MNYPEKIELTVNNDMQAAILYSCFNRSTNDVIENLCGSINNQVRIIGQSLKDITKRDDVSDYINNCRGKIDNILKNNINNKQKVVDNIAKIVVEMEKGDNAGDVKILKFKNIKNQTQLPEEYLRAYPNFYLTNDNALKLTFLNSRNIIETYIFRTNNFFGMGTFKLCLEIMKKAGERLTQINRKEKHIIIKEFSI